MSLAVSSDKISLLFNFICESVDFINQNECSLPVYSNTMIINLILVTALDSEIEQLDK